MRVGEGYFWLRAILILSTAPVSHPSLVRQLQVPPRVEINPTFRELSSFLSRPSRSRSLLLALSLSAQLHSSQFYPDAQGVGVGVDGPFMLC
eukprot:scaffold126186_cov30-Tisochrysis_lutea.AAC.2